MSNNYDYETVLNKLATAINEDYDWCRKTQVILENEGKLEDPATKGFLRGVEYVTSQLLDILERGDRPEIYHAVPKNSGRYPYKSIEDLPEELEPADYITGGNEDE